MQNINEMIPNCERKLVFNMSGSVNCAVTPAFSLLYIVVKVKR